MNQERTVNHVLRDLKLFGLIEEDACGELRPYLMAIYCAGYEEGRLTNQHKGRNLGQYDKRGQLIETYRSFKEACRRTGFSDMGIRKAMFRGTPTKQG